MTIEEAETLAQDVARALTEAWSEYDAWGEDEDDDAWEDDAWSDDGQA